MEEALDTIDASDAQSSDPLPQKELMSQEIDESRGKNTPHETRAELLDKVEEDLVKYGLLEPPHIIEFLTESKFRTIASSSTATHNGKQTFC